MEWVGNIQFLQEQKTDKNWPQRTQKTEVLAASGGKISGFPCGRIQRTACVLRNQSLQSTEKDAVIDCDSLQDTKGDLHYSEDKDSL